MQALENLFERWFRLTGDTLYLTLASTLYTSIGKEQEWALSIKEMIEKRKDCRRNYMGEYEHEKIENSCTCGAKKDDKV